MHLANPVRPEPFDRLRAGESTGEPGASPAGGLRRFLARWAPLLLAALTVAVHANGLANGFVWDDETIVVKNPLTRDLSRIGQVLLSPDERPPYYRPLNRASYLVDHAVFGMDPRGFHAVNVLLQVGCVLALYAVGRRLFRRRLPAVAAAALLAVHPVGVEAVAFVSARNNLFALLFALASFALFIDAVRGRSWARAWASAAAFLLAMLSKEPGAMLLPVLAGWAVLERGGGDPLAARLRRLAPHALAVGAYAVLRSVSLGAPLAAGSAAAGMAPTLAERLAVNLYTVPRYLGIVLFPRDLAIYRTAPPPAPSAIPWLVAAWVAILAVLALLAWRRSVPAWTGLLWLGVNFLPVAGIVALPTTTLIAERYFFIPAVGLWLVAADALERLRGRIGRDRALAAGLAVVVAALGVRTAVRNRDWRDDLTLARSAVEVEPASAAARYNLGLALNERGDVRAARAEWEATLRIDPANALALVALGTLSARDGDAPAAERRLLEAVRVDPSLAEAHLQLGKLYAGLGDAGRARREWETIVARDPGHPAALTELGTSHAEAGDLRAAERYYRAALGADPEAGEALFNMGKLCELTARPAEAAAFYQRFVRVPAADRAAIAIAERRLQLLARAQPR